MAAALRPSTMRLLMLMLSSWWPVKVRLKPDTPYDYGLFLCIGLTRRDNVMDHL